MFSHRSKPGFRLLVFASMCALAAANVATAVDLPESKLDARARAAIASAGSGSRALSGESKLSLNSQGDLEAFILGDFDPDELAAIGVRVRTRLPGMCTATIPLPALSVLTRREDVSQICGARRLEPALDRSVPAVGVDDLRGPGPGFVGINGEGVIVAVVDGGADITHHDFRNQDGTTRILRLWDQTSSDGSPPAGFIYGTEWTSAQIDGGSCTAVDSDGHGTRVLGVAGGDGSATGGAFPQFGFAGVAPRAHLVAVKCRFEYFETDVLDAVDYAFDVATEFNMPCVVNLSLFTNSGPHDGTSPLEHGLDLLSGPGRVVCVAAGNLRGFPWHAEAHAVGPDSTVTILANIAEDGGIFYCDGYYDDGEVEAVSVRTPSGQVIGPIAFGSQNSPYPGQATSNGHVWLYHDDYAGSNEIYLYVTDTVGAPSALGTWTMSFKRAKGATTGEVDLWHGNNYPSMNSGFIVGNQPFEEVVTEPGNARRVITAGAWATKTAFDLCNGDPGSSSETLNDIAAGSGAGPTRDGRVKPDLVAPGYAIGSTQSQYGSPICPASGVPTNLLGDALQHSMGTGTSLASPHVAGACALLLQAAGPLTPEGLRAYLALHARSDVWTGAVPNMRWGTGKLDLSNAVTFVPPIPDRLLGGPRIERIHPSPAAGDVRVSVRLGADQSIEVTIFDLRGSRVRSNLPLSSSGPWGTFLWDRKDDRGVPVTPGVYFVRIEERFGRRADTAKLVVVR